MYKKRASRIPLHIEKDEIPVVPPLLTVYYSPLNRIEAQCLNARTFDNDRTFAKAYLGLRFRFGSSEVHSHTFTTLVHTNH